VGTRDLRTLWSPPSSSSSGWGTWMDGWRDGWRDGWMERTTTQGYYISRQYLPNTGLNFELNKRGSSIIKYISFHLASHLEGVRLWMCTTCYCELLCSTVVGLFGNEKRIPLQIEEQLLLLWTCAMRGEKGHYTMTTRQTQQSAPLYATFCTSDNCCKISAKIVHSL
jgi:hypothetical protein